MVASAQQVPDAEARVVNETADAALLEAYSRRRSADAFAELVARHSGAVLRVCQRLLDSHQDAEDACQAVFLRLAQRPEQVRESVSGWLLTAARSAAGDALRVRRRRDRREEVAAQQRPTTTAPPEAGVREELDVALADLPDRLREAVVLRYLEGRGVREAAALAGCPQGTIGRRASEGLLQMRSFLARRGWVLSAPALLALYAEEAAAAPVTTWTFVPPPPVAARGFWRAVPRFALLTLLALGLLAGAWALTPARERPRIRPVGTWQRTTDDRTVTFTFTAQTMTCAVRGGGRHTTVAADYQVTRDGILFGMITEVKVSEPTKAPQVDDLFQFRYELTPTALTIRDLKPHPGDWQPLLEGEYRRIP